VSDNPPPTERNVPPQRQPLPAVLRQERLQYAILLQILEHETADRWKTVAVCPRTDQRDFEEALLCLLRDGLLAGPTPRRGTLAELAKGGWLTLTEHGLARIYGDDA
jgi:hypothetical protein